MFKRINYTLITALAVATSADPHIRNPLFTRSHYCVTASKQAVYATVTYSEIRHCTDLHLRLCETIQSHKLIIWSCVTCKPLNCTLC